MDNTLDDSWVKSAFLLPADATIGGNEGVLNRIYSTSMQSAADTTLGGSFVLNPLAQWTRYADQKHNVFGYEDARGDNINLPNVSRSRATRQNSSNGMGRTYFEKIFNNMQTVHFRVGVPAFNSLSSFYSNYYSVPAATMARTGRSPGFFYSVGWAAGSVASIPLMPFILVGKAIKFFFKRPASKYYFLKPTMVPYWGAVSSMVNGIAANMGIMPRPFSPGSAPLHEESEQVTKDDIKEFHRLIPHIYREDGGFDVFRIAQRGQAIVNKRRERLNWELDQATSSEEIRKVFQERMYGKDLTEVFKIQGDSSKSYDEYAEIWYANPLAGSADSSEFLAGLDGKIDSSPGGVEKAFEKSLQGKPEGFLQSMMDILTVESQMASEYVSFRVDFTGSQSETFSNSTKEPSIKTNINSISAGARETRFSVFDGNLDGAGIFQKMAESVTDMMKGFGQGFGIQGLAQLGGSAFVDIPNVWDSSSADFNKLTLNIPLRSPYGDPMSRLQNLILPMSALFAMSVPLATGKQSHTSPFILEYFSHGRAHSRLAMVDSLTFTRGVGDVGWNNDGGFLGVDVQLGLVDLTNAVNMPLNPEFSLSDAALQGMGYAIGGIGTWAGGGDADTGGDIGAVAMSALLGSTYDDDNNYTDYLAILGGVPLSDHMNPARKWAIRLAKQQIKLDDLTSSARAGMVASDNIIGETVKLARPLLWSSSERGG